MKIPKKLKVAGHDYSINHPHKFISKEELDGLTLHTPKEIYITGSPEAEHTFWHEMIHCIDHTYNAGQLTEETVTRLAQGLYQVLKDNFDVHTLGESSQSCQHPSCSDPIRESRK